MLYIFDMGGVVLHGVFEMKTILEEQGADLDLMSLYTDDLMDRLQAGTISERDYWSEFNRKHGTSVVSPRWGNTFTPSLDREMLAFLNVLREKNRVVCGSNTIEAHWQASIERGDYSVFDEVYVSHLMGVAKPDIRFWQHILEKEGYDPGDAVFVDDFQGNVDAARSLGIRSYLFTGLDSLRQDLLQPV